MPLFAMVCIDKPDALQVRMAAREDHLAYVRERREQVKLGGPFLDANGDMAGSLIIVEAENLQAAQAWNAADPYTLAGLWERVEIKPFRATIGQL